MIWLPDLTLSSAVEASQLFSLFDDLHRGFEQAGLQQAKRPIDCLRQGEVPKVLAAAQGYAE